MDSFSLFIVVWYALVSEPSGTWAYRQLYENVGTQAECEALAQEHYKEIEKYAEAYKWVPINKGRDKTLVARGMIPVKVGHICE